MHSTLTLFKFFLIAVPVLNLKSNPPCDLLYFPLKNALIQNWPSILLGCRWKMNQTPYFCIASSFMQFCLVLFSAWWVTLQYRRKDQSLS